MRVMRGRPSPEFQNVYVTARIGTPCHSIIAPSLLTGLVHEVARKWRHDLVVTKRDTLETIL